MTTVLHRLRTHSVLPAPASVVSAQVSTDVAHFDHRGRRFAFASLATLALVVVIVFDPSAAQVQAKSMMGSLRNPGDAAFVAAHRGDRANFPENTLPALRAVLESDFNFVEADLHLTADNVPVIIHDKTVDRTTNGTGEVSSFTLAELKKLDAGSWYGAEFAGTRVPSLEEFLVHFADSKKEAMLELKGVWTQDEVRIVTALMNSYGVSDRVIFEAFGYRTLTSLKLAAPQFPRVIIKHHLPQNPVRLAQKFGAIAVLTSPESLIENPQAVQQLHSAGLGIVLYTLNSSQSWSSAITLGVDGIITDRPSSLDAWLARSAPGT
jgi:glycerophosphoryl diester phosphodiesterase